MRRLCFLDELAEPGSRGFTLELPDDGPFDHFLVRSAGQVWAYHNSCPHTGATLEWLPHCFLDADGALIQCGLHGALFRIDTGECLRGPCLGESLKSLQVMVRDGQVFLFGES